MALSGKGRSLVQEPLFFASSYPSDGQAHLPVPMFLRPAIPPLRRTPCLRNHGWRVRPYITPNSCSLGPG